MSSIDAKIKVKLRGDFITGIFSFFDQRCAKIKPPRERQEKNITEYFLNREIP